MTTLYGIPNCDTVKRARAWLDEHGIAYRFHDFKKEGVPEAELDQWLRAPGWEALVNRRGTERVGRSQQHRFTCHLEIVSELADSGGLANTVDAYHQYHERFSGEF